MVGTATQAELGWRTSTLQSFAMKDVTNKSEQVVGNGIISGMNETSMLTANVTNNIIYRTIYGEPICIPKNSGIGGVITENNKNMGEKLSPNKIEAYRKSQMDPKLVVTKKEFGKRTKVYWETGNVPIEREVATEILQMAKNKELFEIGFQRSADGELIERIKRRNKHKRYKEMGVQHPKPYPNPYLEPYEKLAF